MRKEREMEGEERDELVDEESDLSSGKKQPSHSDFGVKTKCGILSIAVHWWIYKCTHTLTHKLRQHSILSLTT